MPKCSQLMNSFKWRSSSLTGICVFEATIWPLAACLAVTCMCVYISNISITLALEWRVGNSPGPCYHPHNLKKRGLNRAICAGWYRPFKILNSSSRSYFNSFKGIDFKLILLTLLFKSLFFKTNLNCSFFVTWYIFNSYSMGLLQICFLKKYKDRYLS